jgi:two-component system chemotaxis response regulator CheY
MPLMTGEEMARHALADPATSGIPIVVVSAEPNLARLQQLVDSGVKGFLRKPFTPEQLRDCVGRTLEKCHA